MGMGIVTEIGMGIDCMGMGGNGNAKSHSRTSLLWRGVSHNYSPILQGCNTAV